MPPAGLWRRARQLLGRDEPPPTHNLFVKVTAQLGVNSRLAVSHTYGHGESQDGTLGRGLRPLPLLLGRSRESRDHQCHQAHLDDRLWQSLLQRAHPGTGGRPADLHPQLGLSEGVRGGRRGRTRRGHGRGLQRGRDWPDGVGADRQLRRGGGRSPAHRRDARRADRPGGRCRGAPGGAWSFDNLDSLARGEANGYVGISQSPARSWRSG